MNFSTPYKLKFSCSKALLTKAFLCQVLMGGEGGSARRVLGWDATLSLAVNITPLCSFTTKGFHELTGSFVFSRNKEDFPTTSLPCSHRSRHLGSLRSQPHETLTGAAQSLPWNQVVKVTRQKAPFVPGRIPFQKCPYVY